MSHYPISVQVLGGPLDGSRVAVPADIFGEDITMCLEGHTYKFLWFMGQPTFVHKETV